MSTTIETTDQKHTHKGLWKFLVPSLLGVLLFMTPVPWDGGITIPVAVLAKSFKAALGSHAVTIVTSLVALTSVLSLLVTLIKPLQRNSLLSALFHTSLPWMVIRVLGGVFAVMTLNKIGPEAIWHEYTGGLVLNDLMPVLLSVFIFAGLLLPLLLNFGLLELIGTLLSKIMRPLFNLPGRSAIDCSTSWCLPRMDW